MYRLVIYILLVCSFLTGSAFGAEQTGVLLEHKIASFLPANAKWALNVVDLETGEETVRIGNTANGLAPGSLMKLFVTGAILDCEDRYGGIDMGTTISYDGVVSIGRLKGDIYLTGRGNALLSATDIVDAAKTLFDNGIRIVEGDVVTDDTLFDTKGLERTRKGPAYASTGALGLDLHTVSVIATASETGKPPMVRIEPPNDDVRFSVSARTVLGTASTIKIKQIDDASYEITGNITESYGTLKERFALKDPGIYACGTFKTILKNAGIKVEGEVRKGKAAVDAKVIARANAKGMIEMLRDINVNSLNVVSDNLLLLLGEKRYGAPGTVDKGVKAIEDFLEGLEGERVWGSQKIKIYDGSGLHKKDRVTSAYMAEFLYKVSERPWFKTFRDSLPSPGEGTLKGLKSDDRFRIKTGVLENAFAMAGYVVDKRKYAFAYIMNGPGTDTAIQMTGSEIMKYLAAEVIQ